MVLASGEQPRAGKSGAGAAPQEYTKGKPPLILFFATRECERLCLSCRSSLPLTHPQRFIGESHLLTGLDLIPSLREHPQIKRFVEELGALMLRRQRHLPFLPGPGPIR